MAHKNVTKVLEVV